MARQDLSRTYLAHHELASEFIIVIIIIIMTCQAYLPCPVQMLVLPFHRLQNIYSKQTSTDSVFVARSSSADKLAGQACGLAMLPRGSV